MQNQNVTDVTTLPIQTHTQFQCYWSISIKQILESHISWKVLLLQLSGKTEHCWSVL